MSEKFEVEQLVTCMNFIFVLMHAGLYNKQLGRHNYLAMFWECGRQFQNYSKINIYLINGDFALQSL